MLKLVLNRRLLFIAAGVLIAGVLTFMFYPRTSDGDDYLFLIDRRSHFTAPFSMSDILTEKQLRDNPQPVVKVIALPHFFLDASDLMRYFEERQKTQTGRLLPFEEMAKARKLTPAEFRGTLSADELFFVLLGTPSRDSKKALRNAIDKNSSITGVERVVLLERIVPVAQPSEYTGADGCQQLDDDLAYAKWNFYGMGLFMDESTVNLLKSCQPFRGADRVPPDPSLERSANGTTPSPGR
jgi:hypothetical protein